MNSRFEMRCTDMFLARIDEVRGGLSRAAFITAAVEDRLGDEEAFTARITVAADPFTPTMPAARVELAPVEQLRQRYARPAHATGCTCPVCKPTR